MNFFSFLNHHNSFVMPTLMINIFYLKNYLTKTLFPFFSKEQTKKNRALWKTTPTAKSTRRRVNETWSKKTFLNEALACCCLFLFDFICINSLNTHTHYRSCLFRACSRRCIIIVSDCEERTIFRDHHHGEHFNNFIISSSHFFLFILWVFSSSTRIKCDKKLLKYIESSFDCKIWNKISFHTWVNIFLHFLEDKVRESAACSTW